jgi:multidrug efflux pump subunit AcrA (membrane-fusion protein)
MPDLSQMQVEIGIHESLVKRIKPGLGARVELSGKTLDGEIVAVAQVAAPAGWWTGSVVKYNTTIRLPSAPGLKPGMSADVEVIIERHENVLTIPVDAVLQTVQGSFCWIQPVAGTVERRALQLGDTDDVSVVVLAGLQEGDEVCLDPLSSIAEAQAMALTPVDRASEGVKQGG